MSTDILQKFPIEAVVGLRALVVFVVWPENSFFVDVIYHAEINTSNLVGRFHFVAKNREALMQRLDQALNWLVARADNNLKACAIKH